ncbi:MAG: cysteine desulfurase [Clostridiales bacterium]|nr:cysteine desulfurase [Clostridiales bacterium]
MAIYLDNSATTRPCEEAILAMEESMREGYFNPSALYAPALMAEKQLRTARELILGSLRAPASYRVIFTAGGTEADNLAILGVLSGIHGGGRILYGAGEHSAVKEACKAAAGFEALEMPYDREGRIDLAALEALLTPDVRMICCMQVNNETGAIQPLDEIRRLRNLHCPQAHFHVDGVQGYLRVPFDMKATDADSYALSAHKIHGPKGVGALVIKNTVKLHPRMVGGGQENNLRSGTENTPGIAGMAAAIRHYPTENQMLQIKMHLWECIKAVIPGASVNGPAPDGPDAAPHILNVSLPPVRSETMLHALEGEGIFIGMGSACAAHKQKVSAVLTAMHTPRPQAESALRFSLCPENTMEEMERTADCLKRNYAILSKFQRR